jgi:hypothetical protein
MKTRRLLPPSPALVISILALIMSMAGTGYAALRLPSNSVGSDQLRRGAVNGSKVKDHSLTGSDIALDALGTVPSAANADHATSADTALSAANATNATSATNATNATTAVKSTNAANLGGFPAADYERVDATLPSGHAESGDYGIRTANTTTTGFIDTSVTFPTPLASRVPPTKIVVTGQTGTTHCTGPGHADPGFLCIYEISTSNVASPPSVFEFEEQFPQNESGNFGFDMEWRVTGASAFSIGTWTVTAP